MGAASISGRLAAATRQVSSSTAVIGVREMLTSLGLLCLLSIFMALLGLVFLLKMTPPPDAIHFQVESFDKKKSVKSLKLDHLFVFTGPSEAGGYAGRGDQRLRSGPGLVLPGHDAGRVLLSGVCHSAHPSCPTCFRLHLHHVKFQPGTVKLFFVLKISLPFFTCIVYTSGPFPASFLL